jgi:HTH-type transcriptional regulator / antitoxin HigA
MEVEPIKSERDYPATLREIESLMTAELGTPDGERLDVLVTVEAIKVRDGSARAYGQGPRTDDRPRFS